MLFDIDKEIDERRYLLLMFALQASEANEFVSVVRYRGIASEGIQEDINPEELVALHFQQLIRLIPASQKHPEGPQMKLWRSPIVV